MTEQTAGARSGSAEPIQHGSLEVALPLQKYDYARVSLMGAFEPTPRDFDRRSIDNYGLNPLWAAPIAWVRGESGAFYSVSRAAMGSLVSPLNITRTEPGGTGADIPEGGNAYVGMVIEEARDDSWSISGGDQFRVELDARVDADWIERDLLHLTCKRLGPTIELYYPAKVAEWYWNSNVFAVSGSILGEKVKGIADIEFGWGRQFYGWLEHPLQAADYWVFFSAEGEDGVEYGTLGLEGNSGFGVIADEHGPKSLLGIEYGGDTDADGMPTVVTWRHRDREWVLTLETQSVASAKMPGYFWQLGTVRRDGRSGIGFVETRTHGYEL